MRCDCRYIYLMKALNWKKIANPGPSLVKLEALLEKYYGKLATSSKISLRNWLDREDLVTQIQRSSSIQRRRCQMLPFSLWALQGRER